ncbi:hypothetical protein TsFJ059_006260 [Trichoderma semiorbis]|uniref:Uncharacterized protein n=1 Tax=Trichoderma semiorbis TaxID=1491008 RepID=A0A9P8H936_9HYPO|nr:hypothetical protein TsFJ059_006260 [Trichoderma semiorbis]
MLFRPVADSTSKLLSSNISNAAHLVVSVYVYRGQARLCTQLIARVICMNKRNEAGRLGISLSHPRWPRWSLFPDLGTRKTPGSSADNRKGEERMLCTAGPLQCGFSRIKKLQSLHRLTHPILLHQVPGSGQDHRLHLNRCRTPLKRVSCDLNLDSHSCPNFAQTGVAHCFHFLSEYHGTFLRDL